MCVILCFLLQFHVWTFVFSNNPIFQMSFFVAVVYCFLTDSLNIFRKKNLWLCFDRWIVLLVIISTTLFFIICGLGTHLFCIHHHLWYNTNRDK
jgi:hypothetical protein